MTEWIAAKQATERSRQRLNAIADTLANTDFPISVPVLGMLHGLSDLHFIVGNMDGTVRSSTLPVASTRATEILKSAIALRSSVVASASDTLSEQIIEIDSEVFRGTALLRSTPNDSVIVLLEPQAEREQARQQIALLPLVTGLVTLILVAAVSLFTTQRVVRRIGSLEEQVRGIAEGSIERVQLRGPHDQLFSLARSVNGMADELRSVWKRIRDTERARLLSQVAGGLAHQLRNAITGIHLAVQLHRRNCPSSEQESLSIAERELERTSQYIKQLLQLAVGKEQRAEPGLLGDILRETQQLLTAIAAHRQIAFTWSISPETASVLVPDRELLRSAIVNLSLNALDAAGASGQVQVESFTENHFALVRVTDSGSGPPASLSPNLFDPFVSSKPEGLGVGLTVVRSAADSMNGSVTWRRESNQTVFELKIPLSQAAA